MKKRHPSEEEKKKLDNSKVPNLNIKGMKKGIEKGDQDLESRHLRGFLGRKITRKEAGWDE